MAFRDTGKNGTMPGPVDDYLSPPALAVRSAVERALAEDLTPLGDLTSVLVPADAVTTAELRARQAGVLAGVDCVIETFAQVDPSLTLTWRLSDGDRLEAGSVIGTVEGHLRTVLTAERTALNFLSHLSGVATNTAAFVDRAAATGSSTRVWDTRKTTPGLRSLQKAAVRAGGGRNHRANLSDAIMVKDNHLTGLGVAEAVGLAKDRWPNRTVVVECERSDQMVVAIEAGADSVLLDNMTPEQVSECVALAAELQGSSPRRCLLEASGAITLETVAAYAATGVDLVSSGAITNSAPVLDIGLDIAT
ncbi:Quinolinate phosphoribosyltransferase (Nicotinate-nucleotide pyrophosphorylase) [Candidatus Microthrix parvicella RN1]|uniref:Nicotinate-nucleotide pyrophosphorylase [carboxylating] n=2 Tax=Microthrixaceae TaxID=1798913 RepID=R4YZC5_9ACTN|nr:Quinolinate phosphoribosyltransferase (Nicotinate-nucleotide pyrophosphorylase) [Candidatus Microthrix parvicella RN1]